MLKNNDANSKSKFKEVLKKKDPNIYTEGITFINCPVHNIQYPKGSSCPKCETEKNRKKNA